MATHDSQDLDGTQRSLEHELREALRLGRLHVGVEHDVPGSAVGFEETAAPPDRDSGDVDVMSDATFADLGSLSEQELRDLIDLFAAREHVISYERRVMHGRMDLLRAELVNRLRKKNNSGEDVIDREEPPAPEGGVREPRPTPPPGPGPLNAAAAVDPHTGGGPGDSY